MRIAIYCGSNSGLDPVYREAAARLAAHLAGQGIGIVYGGGRIGLMGVVADAALAAGGEVIGVIPRALLDKELGHSGVSRLEVVGSMHQRKQLMAERADAFLALPGGIGTFDELFEVWTWRQLGYHDKPIGVLNAGGYYDTLLTFLAQSVKAGFMGPWQMDLLQIARDPDTLLPPLIESAGFVAPDQFSRI
jgi:uncharacterized protein (TIGR00730 family)